MLNLPMEYPCCIYYVKQYPHSQEMCLEDLEVDAVASFVLFYYTLIFAT